LWRPDPDWFVTIHVSTSTRDDLLTPSLTTWEGGSSGNVPYLPLNGALPVKAGETLQITYMLLDALVVSS
jgi:hypothetical protein